MLYPSVEHRIFKPEPFFRGYVFVYIHRDWYFLHSTYGVTRPITCKGIPSIVPNDVISTLRKKHGKDGLIRIPKYRFDVNERVRVKSGPFQYQIGLFQDMSSKGRAKVLFGMLSTNIDERLLEAA